MQLIHKAIWIVSFVTLISLAASFAGQRFLVVPELERIEATADHKDINRVLLGIELIQSGLSQFTYDIGVWDDTMDYFADPQPEYLRRNFNLETFVNQRVNLIVLADNAGQVLWAGQADIASEEQQIADPALVDLLVARMQERLAASPADLSPTDLYATTHAPVAVSVIRVRNTDETGPSPGMLIAARFIDATVVEQISSTLNVDFTATRVGTDNSGPPDDINSLRRGDTQQISWLMGDSQAKPMLRIVLQLGPRGFDDGLFSTPVMLSTTLVIVIWAIVFYLLRRFLISPIVQVAVHLVTVRESGDYSLRVETDQRRDEIGVLNAECNALLRHAQKQADSLTQLSLTDALTQLPNRRHFDQSLEDYWALFMRGGVPLGFLMCDIDFFKPYNDNYGHPEGDAALQKVAQAIADCQRRNSGLSARIGGEEFGILLPATDLDGCISVANRVLEAVEALAIPHDFSELGHISVSIGIACTIPPQHTAPSYLYDAADQALYKAKEGGRARFEVTDMTGVTPGNDDSS